MTEPMVSARIITYNHAPYIAQAVEGVLQQKTDFPFELVIGEDCSTDGTREIVLEYQRKYPDIVRVVTSDKNVGMWENMRRASKVCRGRYLAFCDGDDFWHDRSKLQKQADYLEGHPECGLVYSSYDVYHPNSKKMINDFIKYKNWQMPKSPRLLDFIEGRSEIGSGILTCTVMLRRHLFEEVKASDPYLYHGGHFLMGDTQLWAELSTRTELHYIAESLATHVITEESATRSKDVKKVLQFSISSAELMLYLCNKYDFTRPYTEKYEDQWCGTSLRLAFHRRDKELANQVRARRKSFTKQEWLRYFGAKFLIIHCTCRMASFLLSFCGQKHDQWL